MTTRFTAILLAFAILAVGSSARLFAHEGHEHKQKDKSMTAKAIEVGAAAAATK
jgi:hypothetical protein